MVGGGPAGLSAALVASGNGVRTLLVEAGPRLGGQVRRADAPVADLLGRAFPNGDALADAFGVQARDAGVPVRLGSAVTRIHGEDPLRLALSDGAGIEAGHVLVATGLVPRRLGVPGEALADRQRHARRIASTLRGRSVVVVGGGDEGCDIARCLAEAGARVQLLVRGRVTARHRFASALEGVDGLLVRSNAKVARFEGTGRLEAVVLEDGGRIEATEAFVRIGADPTLPRIDPPVARGADGRVVVDAAGRTSVPRIYAAGDLVRRSWQRYIAVACADGTIVARDVERALRSS